MRRCRVTQGAPFGTVMTWGARVRGGRRGSGGKGYTCHVTDSSCCAAETNTIWYKKNFSCLQTVFQGTKEVDALMRDKMMDSFPRSKTVRCVFTGAVSK